MTEPYTRRQLLRTAGTTLTATGTVGLVATTSTSASTNGQGVLADGFEGSDLLSFARGYSSRYQYYGPPEPVDTLADRARNEFNANADAWLEYGTWLVDEADVTPLGSADVGVEFAVTRWRWFTSSESVETTVRVEYDDDAEEFTDLEWSAGESRDADYRVRIEDHAAESAADELQTFRRKFIGDDHELPSSKYLSEVAGRYKGTIRFDAETTSVLELLIGEVSFDG